MSDAVKLTIAGAALIALVLVLQFTSAPSPPAPPPPKTAAQIAQQLAADKETELKLAAADAEIARWKTEGKPAIFNQEDISGPKPDTYLASAIVKSHLRRTANDPDSVAIQECAVVSGGKTGWSTLCDFRARNGFGALVLQRWLFVIRDSRVVSATQM